MLYRDTCYRCNGTGTFRWFSMGQVAEGDCFACWGRGHNGFVLSMCRRKSLRLAGSEWCADWIN